MVPSISDGYVVVAACTKPRVGQIWAFYDSGGQLIVHRCLGRWKGRWLFQGDALPNIDPPIADSHLVGKVIARAVQSVGDISSDISRLEDICGLLKAFYKLGKLGIKKLQ